MEKIELKYADSIESRLDRYLRSIFPLLTNGLLQKYIRKKYILLNNKKADSNSKVRTNEIVVVPLFFNHLYKDNLEEISHSGLAINLAEKLLKDYLIFSNDDFIIINKPSKLATQGGTDIKLSVDHALSYLNSNKGKEYRIVHRLDKDTSGLLIIASTKDAARILTKSFKDKKIQKQYKAMLFGELRHKSGWVVDGQYQKDFTITETSSYDTLTKFQVISENNHFYYVNFNPITGKKHQLRLDAQSLGASIVGDERHNGYKENNLILHAEKLLISSDIFGKEFVFHSSLPKYFIDSLKTHGL